MRLSVLDQSVAVVDRPQAEAIRNTMALARACEGWGYQRFWVSEHHANATIVGTAPEILIAAIAATTSRIRVGSAGVMLPHYSAFKVAEQFRVLEAIAPGRIDLGLGRAPGSDGRTAFALNPLANERPAQFPNDVRDLMAWVTGGELPEGHHFRTVKAFPPATPRPRSGCSAAPTTAPRSRPTSACRTPSPGSSPRGPAASRRSSSIGSLYRAEPAPSRAARCPVRLGAGRRHRGGGPAPLHLPRPLPPAARPRHLRARSSRPRQPPPPYTPRRSLASPSTAPRRLVGTGADRSPQRIRDLAARMDVQEMAVVTWAYDEAARHKSYRLLAEAMA